MGGWVGVGRDDIKWSGGIIGDWLNVGVATIREINRNNQDLQINGAIEHRDDFTSISSSFNLLGSALYITDINSYGMKLSHSSAYGMGTSANIIEPLFGYFPLLLNPTGTAQVVIGDISSGYFASTALQVMGDIYFSGNMNANGSSGFSGTGSYTNFTFVGGICTSAS